MVGNVNRKNYRDMVLTYVDKLGEIDKLEDELVNSEGETGELKEKINEYKKEVSELKKEIDNHKRRK
ncbi:hypothetical protein [Microcoleus sp. OTE_8_concoct_300]|uniref:hypothetical protein n=1 Tax=Microcoleus sp. OTE_8_concoct_300 TaxID=2964710 RepID=UPI00403F800A